ncbi:MAG: chromophore lyase CpcT/CpeT [Erythrobacter sp.]
MTRASFLGLVLLLTGPLAAQEGGAPPLEAQLAQWLDWFPGRYDSFAQADAQAELPEDERNYRRHSVFRRVDLPAFGPITFYAEQRRWLSGTPIEGEVYRQRIYAITLDEERGAIRLRVHVPKDQTALLGAFAEPSLLEGLTPADTVVWPGCDLIWKWEEGRFIGRLDPGACRFDSPAYGQKVQLEEYLLLSPDEMHFADRGLTMDGEYLFGMRGGEPTIARRARSFSCDVRETGHLGDRRGLWMHDQGGVVLLDAPRPDGSPPMRMRLLDGPKGLLLTVLAAGADGEPLASTRAEAGSDAIGLADGGIEIDCRHDPARMFDSH